MVNSKLREISELIFSESPRPFSLEKEIEIPRMRPIKIRDDETLDLPPKSTPLCRDTLKGPTNQKKNK